MEVCRRLNQGACRRPADLVRDFRISEKLAMDDWGKGVPFLIAGPLVANGSASGSPYLWIGDPATGTVNCRNTMLLLDGVLVPADGNMVVVVRPLGPPSYSGPPNEMDSPPSVWFDNCTIVAPSEPPH
jgi:hypothetical protein